MIANAALVRAVPPQMARRDDLYYGWSNRIAKASLIAAGFSLWTNRGIDVGIQQLSFCQTFSVAAFLASLQQVTVRRGLLPAKTRFMFSLILWPSLAMILVITISMLEAESVFDAVRFYGRWVYGIMFAFALSVACRRDDGFIRLIIMAFLLGGAMTAIVCASGYFVPSIASIVFQDIWSKRALGFLSHPNQLAMLYVGAITLSFWPALCSLPVRAGIMLLLLAGLLMTGSKFNMALAILLVPLLLFWLPAGEGRLAQAGTNIALGVPLVGVIIIGAAYILQQTNGLYYSRLSNFLNDPTDAETTTSRLELYESAWNCMLQKPFFGIGAGNAKECLPFVHAHNVFVNYLLETGLVGLTTLTCFFFFVIGNCVIVIRRSKRLPRKLMRANNEFRMSMLLSSCVISYILSNCSSDSMGPATMPTFWLYIGLTLALGSIVQLRMRVARVVTL